MRANKHEATLGAHADVQDIFHEAAVHPSVLVVNDDSRQLLAITSLLEQPGLELLTATSGDAALKLLLDRDVAVIILDVMMPGLDGFETAALIRQRQRCANTPILFVTAFDHTQTHASRGYSLGAVDYIHAPFLPEVLRAKVGALVELFKKTEQVRQQAQLLREQERREYERMLEEARVREERDKERRIAEVLAEKAAELARSNADLDQFAYLASHDLREPLRTIAGYSLELQRRFCDDAEVNEITGRIIDGVELMDRLIQDLYTYAQVGKRGDVQSTDFTKVFAVACENLRAAIAESSASVTRTDLPTAPAVETECVRLLQNLIGNAIKFRGERPVQVHVAARQDGDHWLFSIRDNGIGIERQYCERIFNVGERLHNKRQYPGTGFGLTICRKIVERHGGRIWVESTYGEGSTFHFTLPTTQAPQIEARRPRPR